MSAYHQKKVKDVQVGDHVMIAGAPPFVVGKRPEWVGGSPLEQTGHVLVEGRTKLGRKARGAVYAWHHTVLCLT